MGFQLNRFFGDERQDTSLLAMASRWRIEAAFLAAPLALWFAHPTHASVLYGVPLVVAGLALRCWARGHLERRAWLTRGGPYAFVRHPLYVGSFAIGLAFSLMTNVPLLALLFVVAFLAAYVPKGIREDAFLQQRYGDEYARYAARVAAWLPRFQRADDAIPAAAEHFTWARVARHREYMTWLGTAVALVAMWLWAR